MPEELWIEDGDLPHYYLSPDIWVVPGLDANGDPGQPCANEEAWVYARVHNKGKEPSSMATVNYYWADPSTVFNRDTAFQIGHSQVQLDFGESRPVLCVRKWIPIFANDGHECLIAEVFSSTDPIIYTDRSFNVKEDRHVAQLNVSVLPQPTEPSNVLFNFSAARPKNDDRKKHILKVNRQKLESKPDILKLKGFERIPTETKLIEDYWLILYRCGQKIKEMGKKDKKLILNLTPNQRVGLALVIKVSDAFKEDEGALFLIEQYAQNDLIGGIGVILGSIKGKDEKEVLVDG